MYVHVHVGGDSLFPAFHMYTCTYTCMYKIQSCACIAQWTWETTTVAVCTSTSTIVIPAFGVSVAVVEKHTHWEMETVST